MDPALVKLDDDPTAKGIHKMITYETGILPARCYFVGPEDSRTLRIVITEESLRAEPLRVPSSEHPVVEDYEAEHGQLDLGEGNGAFYEDASQATADEVIAANLLFPKRREEDITVDDFGKMLDEILYMPFDLEVADPAELREDG